MTTVRVREPAPAAPRKGDPAPTRKPKLYQLPVRAMSKTGYSGQPPKMWTSSTIHAVSPFQNPQKTSTNSICMPLSRLDPAYQSDGATRGVDRNRRATATDCACKVVRPDCTIGHRQIAGHGTTEAARVNIEGGGWRNANDYLAACRRNLRRPSERHIEIHLATWARRLGKPVDSEGENRSANRA